MQFLSTPTGRLISLILTALAAIGLGVAGAPIVRPEPAPCPVAPPCEVAPVAIPVEVVPVVEPAAEVPVIPAVPPVVTQ